MRRFSLAKLKHAYEQVREFVSEKTPLTHDDRARSAWHGFAHFCIRVFKSFLRNRCPSQASALAYTTLLALVPLLALAVGVASSLLKEKGKEPIEQAIDKMISLAAPQLDLVISTNDTDITTNDNGALVNAEANGGTNQLVLTNANGMLITTNAVNGTNGVHALTGREITVHKISDFIENIQSGALQGTGVAGLIMVAILLLSTIEGAFNDIWGVAHGRTWFARVVQYWATLTLGPVLLAVALGLAGSSFFESTNDFITNKLGLGFVMLKVVPIIIISLCFAVFYKLMPNTEVHWDAALIAGAVGGCLWMLNNIFNAVYLSRVAAMSKIYGSLSLVPIFLVGLYFSWMIVLFGAQVAYAVQNRRVYLQDKRAENVNQRGREFVALRIMTFLARRFQNQQEPPRISEMAEDLGTPSRLVGRVLQPLLEARLVVEVNGEEMSYWPGRPLEAITCHDILQTMRAGSGLELETREGSERELLQTEFQRILEAEYQVSASITLKDLAVQLPAEEAVPEPA